MDLNALLFLLLLSIVAFFYSSVGHGGASGYLALMSLYSIDSSFMRSSALLLNIIVSGIAFYQFYRGGNFSWRLFLPFAIASVPMSFIGAGIHLDTEMYRIILGICLMFAAIRISGIINSKVEKNAKSVQLFFALLIGSLIGFISGLIGIGGGILLTPILILLNWARLKEAAAVSALFIFVNSIAGCLGLYISGASYSSEIFYWVLAAMAGGVAGSYYGSRIFNTKALRYLLTIVLVFAGLKLFYI